MPFYHPKPPVGGRCGKAAVQRSALPSSYAFRLSLGQEVEAIVLAVDVERERISLGVKQLDQDAFTTYVSINDRGQSVTGQVKSVDANGAEIDLGNGITGYLRASEIRREKTEDASQVLKVGDEVTAVITKKLVIK